LEPLEEKVTKERLDRFQKKLEVYLKDCLMDFVHLPFSGVVLVEPLWKEFVQPIIHQE
jgi:hypothetical protein